MPGFNGKYQHFGYLICIKIGVRKVEEVGREEGVREIWNEDFVVGTAAHILGYWTYSITVLNQADWLY